MEIEQILSLLQIMGITTAFLAIPLVAWAVYMALQTPPKALKQYIIDTTPVPEPEPVPKRKVLEITVPPEVQARLDELLPAVQLRPEWVRSGGSAN